MESVKVKWFKTQMDAEMARMFLESRGIKSFVQNKSTLSKQSGSRYLCVLEKDAHKAKELLDSLDK